MEREVIVLRPIMIEKYKLLIDSLDKRQRTYMHYRTVANFIDHLDDIVSPEERQKCEMIILAYLDQVRLNTDELKSGSCTTTLYVDFLYPLEKTYDLIGFKRIMPLRLSILLGITVDVVVGLLFFKFPYPILTFLTGLYFFYFERKYYEAGKVYGMLY